MGNPDLGPKEPPRHNHPSYCLSCREWLRLEELPTDFNNRKLVICKKHCKPTWYGWLFNHRRCVSCLKKYFLPWEELCSKCFVIGTGYSFEYFSVSKVRDYFLGNDSCSLEMVVDHWNHRMFQKFRSRHPVGSSVRPSESVGPSYPLGDSESRSGPGGLPQG